MKAKILSQNKKKLDLELMEPGEFSPGEVIELKKIKEPRTLSQNSLYWKLLEFAEPYLYMTKDEIHSGLKTELLSAVHVLPTGEAWEYQKTTSTLDPATFGIFFDQSLNLLAEFGVPVDIFIEQYEKYLMLYR